MSGWKCCGRRVTVSPTADIPTLYRMGHDLQDVVQRALDNVEPWSKGEDPIETVTMSRRLAAIVVPITGRQQVLWGKHPGHHARKVYDSPFVRPSRPATTRDFTVELVGLPSQPRLVRAYPGDYIPPLPWQNSVRDADGGYEAAVRFWREHAYVLTAGLAAAGAINHRAPSWFRR